MKHLGNVVCLFALALVGCDAGTQVPPPTDGGAQSQDGGGQDPCGGITQGGLGGIGAQCSVGFICAPQVVFDCAPGLHCCITNADKPGFCVDPATDGGAPHCF